MPIEQSGSHSTGKSTEALPLLAETLEALTSRGGDERAFSLFQPDILLPAQYFATTKRKLYLEPEKRLMLAVLEDAVLCFQNHVSASTLKDHLLFQDAERWILEKDTDWLFSFEHICEGLGFDPSYVRKGLMRWKQTKLAERPRARIYRLVPRPEHKGERGPDRKALIREFLRELSRFAG